MDDARDSLAKTRIDIFGRLVLIFAFLFCFLFAFQYLVHRLSAQLLYLESKNLVRNGYYGIASAKLEEASRLAPRDAEILRTQGETCYRIAGLKRLPADSLAWAEKAEDAFARAAASNPLDAEAFYGLSKCMTLLRNLHSRLHPGNPDNPYDPLPALLKATALRPNGIEYHYALARYYFEERDTENLLAVMEKIAYNYPPAFDYLVKEPFFAPPLVDAFQNGLERAVQERRRDTSAILYLAKTLEKKEDLPEALSYASRILRMPGYRPSENDYFYAGLLCLKNREPEKASPHFIRSLEKSGRKDHRLERIFRLYRDMGYEEPLYSLLEQAGKHFTTLPGIDIYIARSLIDLKRLNMAERVLNEANDVKPTAEAYYWLARIAEMDRDWDAMELAIQKATLLDPYKSEYRHLFARALRSEGKLVRAEEEASLAIRFGENASPWMFDTRARIRKDRQDYPGAAADWENAILLNDKAAFLHAELAEVYLKMGKYREAVEHYQKATAREPGNDAYKARLSSLENGKGR